MKKQKLIKNIKSLARETSQQWPHEEMVKLPDVLREIDQLDDPEVLSQEITYEDALKVIAENIDTDEFSIGLYLEALSNNEKYEFLTEKWIEDNTSPVDEEGRLYVWKRDLQNLLVPKQGITGEQFVNYAMDNDLVVFEKEALEDRDKNIIEKYTKNKVVTEKPVIPQFVAEWIEKYREHESNVWHLMYNVSVQSVELWSWLWGENNVDVLARAWLDGYTVEEEPKYFVEDNNHTLLCKWESEDGWKVISTIESTEDDLPMEILDFGLTEKEIKDYDPRYWEFRKPVEEMEE